jgi:hypothetical protein
MRVGEAHPFAGQSVKVRGLKLGVDIVAPRLAVAHVIEQDQHDVWQISSCDRREAGKKAPREDYTEPLKPKDVMS